MIGVVLAGGASSRMGRPKSTVEVAGWPMGELVARALSAVCEDVVAAGGPAGGLEVIPDFDGFDNVGPLVGIAAVLDQLGAPIIAVAVDQPWVRVETLQELAARCDDRPVVPMDGGSRQVTCAAYPRSFLPFALDALPDGSIQSALDVAPHLAVDTWSTWGEDGRSWFSVDTIADIGTGIERFGVPVLARN